MIHRGIFISFLSIYTLYFVLNLTSSDITLLPSLRDESIGSNRELAQSTVLSYSYNKNGASLLIQYINQIKSTWNNFLTSWSNNSPTSRRLQFDSMFENAGSMRGRRKKGPAAGGSGGRGPGRVSRPKALMTYVEDAILNIDRYNLWWLGPPESEQPFKIASWSNNKQHNPENNAIFTMATIQGGGDTVICTSPNDFRLYLGTARKFFQGDIVMAVEKGLSDDAIAIINQYNVIAYELSESLCSRATKSIFCGSEDERVPASVFRYFFYEKWAVNYATSSFIMFTDFRDIIFQGNPFEYHLDEWYPEYQLVLFQEFHPNMVINRCRFNTRIMDECYGSNTLKVLGTRIIVSSGAAMGTRDAIITWSHHLTLQLQEAPGRVVETRCASGGIDHAFINYLTYNNKVRGLMRTKVFSQGEGAVNTIGGLRPNTVVANITGDIKSFWRLLDDNNNILNWNGEVSPVVHQLDHFLDELEGIVDEQVKEGKLALKSDVDKGWHAVSSSKCLWGC
jgi:hypothetical protein